MTYHLYELDDGETHWYSATSEEDAVQRFLDNAFGSKAKMTHAKYVEDFGPLMAVLIPDDKPFTVGMENERGDYDDETMKAREWAELRPGECVATTCV